MKKKVLFTAFICSVVLLALCSNYFIFSQPSSLHAQQIGANVRENIMKAAIDFQDEPMSEQEMEEYQKRLDSMDFKFAIPENYKQESKSSVDVYVSPINQYETPDMWLSVSVKERAELSQIPDSLLKDMSTEELIVACMNYNLLCDLFVYDSPRQGYETLKKQYNGIQELTKRLDSGEKLLELYKAIDINKFHEEDRFSTIRMTLLNMLISDEDVLKTLSKDKVKEMVQECYKKGLEMIEGKISLLDYLQSASTGLKCLYFHDNNAREIIDDSDELKSFILGNNRFFTLDNIDDVTIGKITIVIQDNYL